MTQTDPIAAAEAVLAKYENGLNSAAEIFLHDALFNLIAHARRLTAPLDADEGPELVANLRGLRLIEDMAEDAFAAADLIERQAKMADSCGLSLFVLVG